MFWFFGSAVNLIKIKYYTLRSNEFLNEEKKRIFITVSGLEESPWLPRDSNWLLAHLHAEAVLAQALFYNRGADTSSVIFHKVFKSTPESTIRKFTNHEVEHRVHYGPWVLIKRYFYFRCSYYILVFIIINPYRQFVWMKIVKQSNCLQLYFTCTNKSVLIS